MTRRVRIKVCGLTRRKDVELAVELGADAVGFILAPSPRRITLEQAALLAADLPPFVESVAVVVNPTREETERIAASGLFTRIQYSGEEPPELVARSPLKAVKAIGVTDAADPAAATRFPEATILFDARRGGRTGGTGERFDWELLRRSAFSRPFILAGGLGPENLREALDALSPWAVDLNSRVERAPGEKDPVLLRRCFAIVAAWNEEAATAPRRDPGAAIPRNSSGGIPRREASPRRGESDEKECLS